MTNKNLDSLLNDDAILEEIGLRLQRRRLDMEWTQAELATHAGVSKRTIERMEAGNSTQLVSFIRALRALDLLPALDEVLPRPGPRPMELLSMKGEQRKRAPRKKSDAHGEWTWGEE